MLSYELQKKYDKKNKKQRGCKSFILLIFNLVHVLSCICPDPEEYGGDYKHLQIYRKCSIIGDIMSGFWWEWPVGKHTQWYGWAY